ncbi:MAG: nicotinate-nucleotide adenylyltransferase [Gemmatimonadaceae bacterium]
MRIGVLGGTFDPPHAGHLLAAVDAFEALALDRLLIVPAAVQPLRTDSPPGASPAQRLDMARLAFGGDARFEVTSVEIDRGGLSYTVDTLEAVSAANPGCELVLIAGTDTLATLDRWKDPERILKLARIAGVSRAATPAARSAAKPARPGDGMVPVTPRRVDVSSSEIRRRLKAGKSVKGFVAESVEDYISAAKLYRS